MTEPGPDTPPGARVRLEPLWLRVDRNRSKLAVFVLAFVGVAPGAAAGICNNSYKRQQVRRLPGLQRVLPRTSQGGGT